MIRNIIRYGIIVLVLIGMFLVIRNVTTNNNWKDNNNKNKQEKYYQVNITLIDRDSNQKVVGAKLSVIDSNGDEIDTWITADNSHTISKLPKGSYALKQVQEASGYELNEETIDFKITDKALDIVMYNDKIEVEMTNNEVSVESTSSFRNYGSLIIGILFSELGIMLLYKLKKEQNILVK